MEKFLRLIFGLAAAYNIFWGVTTALFPNLLFHFYGVPPINEPLLMRAAGLGIILLGYLYWMVARDLARYPELAVVGFFSKVLGPICWGWLASMRGLPVSVTFLADFFNDVAWLPFFVAYFLWYMKEGRHRRTRRELPSKASINAPNI